MRNYTLSGGAIREQGFTCGGGGFERGGSLRLRLPSPHRNSKAIAVVPRHRIECVVSVPSSSLSQFDLELREKTVRWLGVKRRDMKSSTHGGTARGSIWVVFGRLGARERRLER